MRTGAIFARGSCRALKWMALFGVVLALGTAQAVAQTDATWVGTYTPGENTIEVALSGDEVGTLSFQGDLTADGVFTVANGPAGAEVTAVSQPSGGKFTLTLSHPIETTVSTGRPTLEYAGSPSGRIVETGGTTTTPTDVAAEGAFDLREMDIPPMLPADLEDREFKFILGEEVDEEALPMGTGGNTSELTYQLARQSDLPPGVTFSNTSRKFMGTPTKVGTYEEIYYEVADDNANLSTADPTEVIDTVKLQDVFKLTIEVLAADDTPDPGTGTRGVVTSTKLTGVDQKTIGSVKRNHVGEGSTGVKLVVDVEWLGSELEAIYGSKDKLTGADAYASLDVQIMPGTATNWASEIDAQQDVHFPDSRVTEGVISDVVRVPYPTKPRAGFRANQAYSEDGDIPVYILPDADAENEVFFIEVMSSDDVDVDHRGSRGRTMTLDTVIEDDETQSVTIVGSARLYEDVGKAEYKVTAKPARVNLPLKIRLDLVNLADDTRVRADKYSISDANPTLEGGATTTVTLELPDSDGDRMDNDYKLVATSVEYSLTSGVDDTFKDVEHPITVVDVHKLPRLEVTPKTGMVKEGGEVELTLMLNREIKERGVETQTASNEAVRVMLMANAMSTAGRDDYELPAMVEFPKPKTGEKSQTMSVKIKATMDDMLGEKEMLVLDAEVDGTMNSSYGENSDDDKYSSVSELTIEDATQKLVRAKENVEDTVYAAKKKGMGADEKFNPGEMIELMGDALFDAPVEGTTLSFTAESDNTDVATVAVSGGAVTVTAGTKTGEMAHITITAHASMPSGVEILDQTDPGEASIRFPVEVGLAALTIMLSGPEDMNLVEGGMGKMVTATANRMVTADTKVMLMRDLAMSSASDEDFTAEPITILAGQMKGSTMVMAVEDNMMENDGNMTEKLVLFGQMEGDMAVPVEGKVEFYVWDAAVPALPVIAQLLLAAFLAVGGFRRYRRR